MTVLFQMEDLRMHQKESGEFVKDSNCFIENAQNIALTNYGSIVTEDAKACQEASANQKITRCVGCDYWTFQKSTGNCIFKLNQTLGGYDPDWVSGPQHC